MPASVTERGGLLAWCRAGFEAELAAELSARASAAGFAGYAKTQRDSGLVQYLCDDGNALVQALPWRSLIFARQSLRLIAELDQLDPSDRIAPLLSALQRYVPDARYGELLIEHADSDSGRPLSGLARALGNALRGVLRKRGLLSPKDNPNKPRLHIGLLDGQHLLIAESDSRHSPSWPGGIPRLRAQAAAPSRSALKLEEALIVLLTPEERERWLQPGMKAADLGAAPGGWSWVLASQQHVQVSAIDNGPLAESALATGLIQHLRADGFRWQPAKPLDWMVCDMVEQPRRVAERMAIWLREGWCRRTIFNLKLPMKKRWEETRLCLDLLSEVSGLALDIRAKQLYHDREEITVYAGPRSR